MKIYYNNMIIFFMNKMKNITQKKYYLFYVYSSDFAKSIWLYNFLSLLQCKNKL
jgi:hypothetical protein